MRLYDAWAERKRAEVAQLAGLDARHVTPSTRDLGTALRMGRRDLVGIPLVAAAGAVAARALGGAAVSADAAVVAVATDAGHGGSLTAMKAVSELAGATPVLRWDLVLHEAQVYETRLAGGDALVLPQPLLSQEELRRLMKAAAGAHLTPLVLLHDDAGLAVAQALGARFVAVSAEKLDGTGEDLPAALALCGRIPGSLSVCLHAPSLVHPGAVRALTGKVDGALLAPHFPPESFAEVAVLDAPS